MNRRVLARRASTYLDTLPVWAQALGEERVELEALLDLFTRREALGRIRRQNDAHVRAVTCLEHELRDRWDVFRALVRLRLSWVVRRLASIEQEAAS